MMSFEFKNIVTADQSPSLSFPPTWEPMHSLEGAFSETQYIYRPTVESAFTQASSPSFLSLGLGLGYNEILIASLFLKTKKTPTLIRSFELVSELRDFFCLWMENKTSPLASVYDTILSLYAAHDGLPVDELKQALVDLWKKNILRIEGPVTIHTHLEPMNAILFDAFCAKTSPDLWTVEFLHSFFRNAGGSPCFVSTYACTGELKRALAAAGFAVEKRKGFAFKRESTFAQKK